MTPPDLTDLAAEIHANANAKGWWPETPGPEDYARAALMIGCEVAEMVEEYRRQSDDSQINVIRWLSPDGSVHLTQRPCTGRAWRPVVGHKPEGFAIELADIVIRTLDLCAAMGNASDVYVDRREPEAMDGAPFAEVARLMMHDATLAAHGYCGIGEQGQLIGWSEHLAQRYNIDLWAMVRLKHAYNLTRSHRHGGMRL